MGRTTVQSEEGKKRGSLSTLNIPYFLVQITEQFKLSRPILCTAVHESVTFSRVPRLSLAVLSPFSSFSVVSSIYSSDGLSLALPLPHPTCTHHI